MRRLSPLIASASVVLVGLGLLFPVVSAQAAPPYGGGVVIWNSDYTLATGEQISGDLMVVNGDVTLEGGSTVRGSVVVWNGKADVQGAVEGSVLVSGGSIHLRDTAQVDGDVVCSGDCTLVRDEGAHVGGAVAWEETLDDLWRPGGLLTVWAAGPGEVLGWVFRAVQTVAGLSVMAAVAWLVALVWPTRTRRVGRMLLDFPWLSLGLGLLAFNAVGVLILVLVLTLCLSLLAVLLTLVLGSAMLLGWVSIGTVFGDWLLRARGVQAETPLAAGLGTAVITSVILALFYLHAATIAWVLMIGLGSAGLGAVILFWWFGSLYFDLDGVVVGS